MAVGDEGQGAHDEVESDSQSREQNEILPEDAAEPEDEYTVQKGGSDEVSKDEGEDEYEGYDEEGYEEGYGEEGNEEESEEEGEAGYGDGYEEEYEMGGNEAQNTFLAESKAKVGAFVPRLPHVTTLGSGAQSADFLDDHHLISEKEKTRLSRNAFALVVTVVNYDNIRSLNPFLHEDGIKIYETLVNPFICRYPPDNCVHLMDPTREALLEALQQLKAACATAPQPQDATLFVYICSHGGRILGGRHKGDYVCTREVQPKTKRFYGTTAVELGEVKRVIDEIHFPTLLCLDCNHQADLQGVRRSRDKQLALTVRAIKFPIRPFFLKSSLLKPKDDKCVILYAWSKDEVCLYGGGQPPPADAGDSSVDKEALAAQERERKRKEAREAAAESNSVAAASKSRRELEKERRERLRRIKEKNAAASGKVLKETRREKEERKKQEAADARRAERLRLRALSGVDNDHGLFGRAIADGLRGLARVKAVHKQHTLPCETVMRSARGQKGAALRLEEARRRRTLTAKLLKKEPVFLTGEAAEEERAETAVERESITAWHLIRFVMSRVIRWSVRSVKEKGGWRKEQVVQQVATQHPSHASASAYEEAATRLDADAGFCITYTPARPSPPTAPAMYTNTHSTIGVYWNAMSWRGSPVLEFHLQRRALGRVNTGWHTVTTSLGGSRSTDPAAPTAIATALCEDMQYRFRVRARNPGGWSDWSGESYSLRTSVFFTSSFLYTTEGGITDDVSERVRDLMRAAVAAGPAQVLAIMAEKASRDVQLLGLGCLIGYVHTVPPQGGFWPLDELFEADTVGALLRVMRHYPLSAKVQARCCVLLGMMHKHIRQASLTGNISEKEVVALVRQARSNLPTSGVVQGCASYAITFLTKQLTRHEAACKLQGLFRTRRSRKLMRMLIRGAFTKEIDSMTGQPYYTNQYTGETQWEKPVNLGSEDLTVTGSGGAAAAAEAYDPQQ